MGSSELPADEKMGQEYFGGADCTNTTALRTLEANALFFLSAALLFCFRWKWKNPQFKLTNKLLPRPKSIIRDFRRFVFLASLVSARNNEQTDKEDINARSLSTEKRSPR